MGKILGVALVVLALSAAACADGDDDDGGVLDDISTDKDDKGKDGKADSGKRAAYIKALKRSAQTPDPEDENELILSDEGAECLAESYMDVIGLKAMESKVTPEEILEEPTADHNDWGIEMTDEQGTELFRQLIECEPSVMQDLAESMASSMTGDEEFPLDPDVDCLAATDPDDIEGFMGAAFADGDDFDPTDEQARNLFDWIDGCADLKGAMIEAFENDPEMPAGVAACLDDKLTEQQVKDLMIAGALAEDDVEIEDIPEGAAFMDAIRACATSVGVGT